jgi:hypothetical protein
MSDLLNHSNDIRCTVRPRPTFTLESGRGEIHLHPRLLLYTHSVYARGSVLAGQSRRLWVALLDTWDEARSALAEVRKEDVTHKFEDYCEGAARPPQAVTNPPS